MQKNIKLALFMSLTMAIKSMLHFVFVSIAVTFALASTANAASLEWYAVAFSQEYITQGDATLGVMGCITKSPGNWIADADGEMLCYQDGDKLRIKKYDRRTTPIGDENVTFAIMYYGALLSASTIDSAAKLPLCEWDSHDHEGGLVIDDPTDFYLGFMVPEGKTIDGVVRYGWYHLSFEDGYDDVELIDSGIGLYGESVYVGVGPVPEPSGALLVLLGCAGLLLRRRGREVA